MGNSTNLVIGGSFRRKRGVGNLANVSDLLVHPILPGFSSFHRQSSRRRCSLSGGQEMPLSRRQSISSNCPRRRKSLKLVGWYHSPVNKRMSSRRNLPSRNSRKAVFSHKYSKTWNRFWSIKDLVTLNPEARPSFCAIITGLVIIICGIFIFSSSFFYSRLPEWLFVVIVAIGAAVIFGGVIAAVVYLRRFQVSNQLKLLEENMWSLNEDRIDIKHLQNTKQSTSFHQRISQKKAAKLHKASGEAVLPNATNCYQQDKKSFHALDHDCVQPDDTTIRRKLPSFPYFIAQGPSHSAIVVTSHKFDQFSERTDSSLGHTTASVSMPHSTNNSLQLNYPNASATENRSDEECEVAKRYLTERSHFNYLSLICPEMPQKDLSLKDLKVKQATNRQFLTHGDDQSAFCQISSKETLLQSLKANTAKELFDAYHDPLIYRAVTNITFQCDCEFGKRSTLTNKSKESKARWEKHYLP